MFKKIKDLFFKKKKDYADLSPEEKACVLALLNSRPKDIFHDKNKSF